MSERGKRRERERSELGATAHLMTESFSLLVKLQLMIVSIDSSGAEVRGSTLHPVGYKTLAGTGERLRDSCEQWKMRRERDLTHTNTHTHAPLTCRHLLDLNDRETLESGIAVKGLIKPSTHAQNSSSPHCPRPNPPTPHPLTYTSDSRPPVDVDQSSIDSVDHGIDGSRIHTLLSVDREEPPRAAV